MKITKRQLRRIIKEEVQLLNESGNRSRIEVTLRDYFVNKDDPKDAALAVYEDYEDIQMMLQISAATEASDIEFSNYVWLVHEEASKIRSDGSNMFDEPDRYGGSRRY